MFNHLIPQFTPRQQLLLKISGYAILGSLIFYGFYQFYQTDQLNIFVVFFTVSFIFGIGLFIANKAAKSLSKQLIDAFAPKIEENIKKSLVVSETNHRLSALELNAIGKTATKNLDKVINEAFRKQLFKFYTIGIIAFVVIIFILFHQSSLKDIFAFIFQAKCP